jgi:hypothetical protein
MHRNPEDYEENFYSREDHATYISCKGFKVLRKIFRPAKRDEGTVGWHMKGKAL